MGPTFERSSHDRRGESSLSVQVEEADELLDKLRAAQAAVMANLLDLESEGTYELLCSANGLSGETKAAAEPALAGAAVLWRDRELINELIQRADLVRGKGRLNDRRAAELIALLNGPSIHIPANPVPLAERDLTKDPDAG